MKKHDENKDVKLVSRITRVDSVTKTVYVSKYAGLGIRTWGRIDFLCNYCGYVLLWDNAASKKSSNVGDNTSNAKRKREAKKAAKEQTLTNKKKK